MQPASTSGASGGNNRQLKRWGPIAGVLAVVAIGAGVLVATSGDDDSKSVDGATTTVAVEETTPPEETTAPTDTAVAPDTTGVPSTQITFPLSFPRRSSRASKAMSSGAIVVTPLAVGWQYPITSHRSAWHRSPATTVAPLQTV